MTEQNHHYGDRFHLINDVFSQTLLTEMCSPQMTQPALNQTIQKLYTNLVMAAANEVFPKVSVTRKTRMNADLTAQIIDPDIRAVTVNLARAGTYPSHICYEFLHSFLKPENIRQDHIFASRVTNANDQVTGSHLGSYKIGGEITNSFVLFPDPMGATGGTLETAMNTYEKEIQGPVRQYIALHLIVTPEYLKKILNLPFNIKIFALRVDRGMSESHVLKSPLGLYWDQEKGLNNQQYIIPGAGGLGELLNNSFV